MTQDPDCLQSRQKHCSVRLPPHRKRSSLHQQPHVRVRLASTYQQLVCCGCPFVGLFSPFVGLFSHLTVRCQWPLLLLWQVTDPVPEPRGTAQDVLAWRWRLARLTAVPQVVLRMVGRQLFCCGQNVRGLLKLKAVPQMVLTMVGKQFFSSPAPPCIQAWRHAPQIGRVGKVTRLGD